MTGSSHSAPLPAGQIVGKDRAQRLVQVINKIPLFGGWDHRRCRPFSAPASLRFEEGDVLCAADTPGEELFILLTGQVGV